MLYEVITGYGGVVKWWISIGSIVYGQVIPLLSVITSYSIHYTKLYDSGATPLISRASIFPMGDF